MTTTFFLDLQGLVWLGGPDRLTFLDRMGTGRLRDLAPGQGRATVLTTDEGRALDLVACHAGPTGAALVCSSRAAAAKVAAQLLRYRLRDQVTVTDATPQVLVCRLQGEGAWELGGRAFGEEPLPPLAPGDWLQRGEGAGERWLLRHPEGAGLGGLDLVLPREAAPALAEALLAAGAVAGDPATYDQARVAALLPMDGAEIDGRSNPLELGLTALVDFDKGCYIGQEVIARQHHYERLRQRLRQVRLTEALPAGSPWPPGAAGGRQRPGRLTTVVPDPAGAGWLGLALENLPTGEVPEA